MKLSENLKRIRNENNLSQEQLAEQLGVSRQSVSKWESGQTYPEMDKVLLICKLYNYKIDELMNENVQEVNETKESKVNFNKYVDNFFDYITKTVDMFCSFSFKQKFKCVCEQLVVFLILYLLINIIGNLGSSIIGKIFVGVPSKVSSVLLGIFNGIYILAAAIVGITVFLHIFKTRYLDYYEIVKEDNVEDINVNNEEKVLKDERKREKIVIRDSEHGEYNFLNGFGKFVIWCFKIFLAFIGLHFAGALIGWITCFVLSFAFIKTGLMFLGAFMGIVGAILVHLIILELIYNFIANKKNKKARMAITFIVALVLAGAGIGVGILGLSKINYVKVAEDTQLVSDEYNVAMTDNLSLSTHGDDVEYVEENRDDIKIVVKHSKYFKIDLLNKNDVVYIDNYMEGMNFSDVMKEFISDLGDNTIRNYMYDDCMITVYGSKANIEKLKANRALKDNEESKIDKLNNKLSNSEDRISELESKLEDQNSIIEQYKEVY